MSLLAIPLDHAIRVGRALLDPAAIAVGPIRQAAAVTTIYGCLALMAARHLRRSPSRTLVTALFALAPAVIGTAWLYRGVPHVGEVLAGWTAGFGALLGLTSFCRAGTTAAVGTGRWTRLGPGRRGRRFSQRRWKRLSRGCRLPYRNYSRLED
jgi:membrane-associated phospholipid phosphatase